MKVTCIRHTQEYLRKFVEVENSKTVCCRILKSMHSFIVRSILCELLAICQCDEKETFLWTEVPSVPSLGCVGRIRQPGTLQVRKAGPQTWSVFSRPHFSV